MIIKFCRNENLWPIVLTILICTAYCTVDIYRYGLMHCRCFHVRLLHCKNEYAWPGLLYYRYLHVRSIFLYIFTWMAYFTDIYMYRLFSCIYSHVRPIFLYIFTWTAYFPVYFYSHIRPIVNVLEIFTCTTF